MINIISVFLLIIILISFLSYADKKHKFEKLSLLKKQVVIGFLFSLISIFATFIDYDLGDVPALCAGLLFGPVAGLVSGLISAVQIGIVALLDPSSYIQMYSAASVLAAGIYAGLFRKFLLEDRHPPLIYGVLTVLITRLSFLFILLITNIDNLSFAFAQASDGAVAILISNIAGVIIGIMTARMFHFKEYQNYKKNKTISSSFQFGLLVCVIVAFVSTFYFTVATQKQIEESQTEDLIRLNVADAKNYTTESGQSIYDLINFLPNWRVGKEGGITAFDKDMNVVSKGGLDITKNKNKVLTNTTDMMVMESNGHKYYCVVSEYRGYYLMGYISKTEALYFYVVSIYSTVFVETLIFVMLYISAIILSKRLIVKNIDRINIDLQSITNGNLEQIVNVRAFKEFDDLSNYINSTVSTLKDYIQMANEQIDKELQFAQEIQHAALPSIFPPYPNRDDLEIFGNMFTAKEVGGDFYDFYFVGDDKLAFIIADVSGKGIPAAMFMMVAKTMIKSYAEAGMEVNEVLNWTNIKLCEHNDVGMFVTAWMGIIDLKTGLVKYANAGHNPPMICRKDGRFEYLRSKPNLVLAAMENVKYQTHEIKLAKGDVLFMYTDGITESINPAEELYNEVRLYKLLNNRKYDSMQEICETVKADVDDYIGEEPQFDDITMLAFKYKGVENIMKELLINATVDNIPKVTEFVDIELEKFDCPMKAQTQIDIAIDELFGNIAQYAYDPEVGPATVRVEVMDDPLLVVITFIDNGVQYDPLTKEDPNLTLNAEERNLGGLGIYIVKKSMDEITYEYKNGQNILRIKKTMK